MVKEKQTLAAANPLNFGPTNSDAIKLAVGMMPPWETPFKNHKAIASQTLLTKLIAKAVKMHIADEGYKVVLRPYLMKGHILISEIQLICEILHVLMEYTGFELVFCFDSV